MGPKLIADENIPIEVVEALRGASYEVSTVSEAAHPGMKNEGLAELSIQLRKIIVTRDADFTHLRRSLMREIKVIYIRVSGDPHSIAQYVLDEIEGCVNILRDHNVAMLDQEGCHAL
mgnify:CR=1 FL=1